MGYEIDWHAVGEESKSGDAITTHWGNLYSETRRERCVVVIDGGFKDTGDTIADHIVQHYNTNHVDLVISTHPDNDHINGLLTRSSRWGGVVACRTRGALCRFSSAGVRAVRSGVVCGELVE